jgi:hypothetical protein
MRTTARKTLTAIVAGALLFSFCGLAACLGGTTEASADLATEEREEALRTIGEPSNDAFGLVIENATGKDIVGIFAKVSTETAYGASVLGASEEIADGETVLLYIPVSVLAATPAASELSEKTPAETDNPSVDVLLRTRYNVLLTFDDDSTAELHDLNFEDMEQLRFCRDTSGIAYVEFENGEDEPESTLETERALKEAADAAAKAQAEAEAAAQAEAEAAARAAAEAEAAASQYQYNYGGGTGGSAGTGSQSVDNCVDPGDLVLR